MTRNNLLTLFHVGKTKSLETCLLTGVLIATNIKGRKLEG